MPNLAYPNYSQKKKYPGHKADTFLAGQGISLQPEGFEHALLLSEGFEYLPEIRGSHGGQGGGSGFSAGQRASYRELPDDPNRNLAFAGAPQRLTQPGTILSGKDKPGRLKKSKLTESGTARGLLELLGFETTLGAGGRRR